MSLHPQLGRAARLVLIGGLATGAGFGAIAAVNAATSPSPSATASPGTGDHSNAPEHGFRRDGPHHGHMLGGGGTITSINGTTLTLRTENGTETVTTSGSTTFTKERRTIRLSDLQVGDVVHVLAASAPAAGTTPGTGTVAASRVMVVEPEIGGRVQSIDGDTLHLVGRDGRLFTVTLTDSTQYFSGRDATAKRSDITTGRRVVAEGRQDTLTHLTAGDVVILPTGAGPDGGPAMHPDMGGFGPGEPGGPGGPGAFGGPGGPGGADMPAPPDDAGSV